MSEPYTGNEQLKDAIGNGLIQNGIVLGDNSIGVDTRDLNRTNIRIDAQDPTSTIDAPSSTEILKFPHDLPKYYMTFAFSEYRRPSQFAGLTSTGIQDYIALPMPSNLKDTSTMNYSETSGVGFIEAATQIWNERSDAANANKLSSTIDSLTSVDGIKGLLGDAGGVAGAMGKNIALKSSRNLLKGTVLDGAVDGGLQLLGIADNPFATVTFNGPNFKSHAFTWRLSAKSPEESETIRKIVNTLKKVAHPELLTAATGGFYKYPWIVWTKFKPVEMESHLYRFKPAVITEISADYAPNDRPGFFTTMAPVEVVLTIHLKEIEIWKDGMQGGDVTKGEYSVVSGDFSKDGIVSPPRYTPDQINGQFKIPFTDFTI